MNILISILALLIYSGPLVPMSMPLLFRRASHARFRRNLRVLLILSGVQVLSFGPFWVALAHVGFDDEGLALPWLFLPFFLGALLFVITSIYAATECWHLRSLLRPPNSALQQTEARLEPML